MICPVINPALPMLLTGHNPYAVQDLKDIMMAVLSNKQLISRLNTGDPYWQEFTTFPGRFDFQMQVTAENLDTAAHYKPESCTLVRGRRDEERAISAALYSQPLTNAVKEIHAWGGLVFICVPAFSQEDLAAVKETGADGIEINFDFPAGNFREEICYTERTAEYAETAQKQGLQFSLSGNIDFMNITAILRIKHLQSLDISRTVFVRAMSTGLPAAADEMLALLQ